MKKFFALALALVLTCALAVTCFAEYTPTMDALTDSATNDVKVTYVAGGTSAEIYAVDVVFDEMNFTYTAASEGTWDPETHTYKNIEEAKWNKTSAAIKVTNHSNVALDVTVTYAKAATYEGAVTPTISNGEFELARATAGSEFAAAPTATATLNIGAGVPVSGNTNLTIGTVTVAIAAAQ